VGTLVSCYQKGETIDQNSSMLKYFFFNILL
jgi:hypothetical protein